jgi:hypothetical protein
MLLLHHSEDKDKGLNMLTKLLPDQISKFWPVIKYAVEESLPPMVGDHPDKMNRILSGMLSGKIDVWVSYIKGDEVIKFEAVLVTQLLYEEASNTKNLLLYCLYGYSVITDLSWTEGFETISKYAKSQGCSGIIAYSANTYIVELSKKFGADVSYTLINIPLKSV